MDKGLRVVGFTFSNHGESTLNAEVSNAKLQTQRSLLSELLAVHAVESGGLSSDSESEDSGDEDAYNAEVAEPTPVQVEAFRRSSPITIPCPESLANQRAKDAYRRLLYQRHVEQLYYQQQQQRLQLQYQQQVWMHYQQRRLQLQQQQQQAAPVKRQAVQEDEQSRSQTGTVPVY